MNQHRTIQGTVVANKNDKTIVVMLNGYRKHSKYLKRVQFRSKFYAHDENNEAKVGDFVTIEECRPMSRTKRFKLVSIDKKALEDIKVVEEQLTADILNKDVKQEETVSEEVVASEAEVTTNEEEKKGEEE